MIPEEIKGKLMPELAAPGEDVPRVELACGVALKFTVDEETIGRPEFGTWGVSVREAGAVAGDNAFSYLQWVEAEEGVFVNSDHCWPALVLAPPVFIEHNWVPGRPVVYVVDEKTAILTGSNCPAGLARIREAMRDGLAACAMVLNGDYETWSRFHVHDATAIDLPRVTIKGQGKGEGRYRRQSGPPGHYGHVILEVEPYVGAYDYLFVWAVDEETIPSEFREAVWEGIQLYTSEYIRETGPLVGIRVTITGGSYHEVDSHATSFRVAATIAFKNAVEQMALSALPERRREQGSGEAL